MKKVLAMLFGIGRQAATPADPSGTVSIAVERNEKAAVRVREALEDMLAASDRARGILTEASQHARGTGK